MGYFILFLAATAKIQAMDAVATNAVIGLSATAPSIAAVLPTIAPAIPTATASLISNPLLAVGK
jgi:poly(U)-binding-splicing factor PUF60